MNEASPPAPEADGVPPETLPPAPRPPAPRPLAPPSTAAPSPDAPPSGSPRVASESDADTTRWKPLRGGLINLFKYQDQVFEYAGGRLLLRGDNGSGKSRVLALQLPFLLDGDLNPRRVEPDRDPAKKVEWNLLMDRHENRLGYTWIEFHRLVDGEARYLTLGCGLHARKGSDLKRWFFITEHRVHHEVRLVLNDAPLNERQLREHLDGLGGGTVYKKAGDYREAIDQALFRLGGRYRPLLDLLIQLRQPQLMRDMKEDALSNALSEALAPVHGGLINQVAESFQGLDSDRQRTEEYRATLESVEAFRDNYAQYLATAIRRLCDVVRRSHSRFERATKEARTVEQSLGELRQGIARDQGALVSTRDELTGLEAEIQTLQASPEMRGKRDLDAALQAADRAEATAAETRSLRERAESRHDQAAVEDQRREADCAAAREVLITAASDLRRDHARVAPAQDTSLAFLDAADWADREDAAESSPRVLRERLTEFTGRRARSVEQLERRNTELRQAHTQLERARDEVARAREQVAEASAAADTRQTIRDEGVEAFGQAVRAWETELVVLTEAEFPRRQPWQETMDDWLADPEGDAPFDAALAGARDAVSDALATQRAEADRQQREVAAEKEAVEAELGTLREGRHPVPPHPHTRSQRRADRPGGPLWQLIDFNDNVPGSERAGWEAALEAAGLLDAWVLPDGRVHRRGDASGANSNDDSNDDFLLAEAPGLPSLPGERSLAAIFHAEAGGAVPEPVINALLQRVGNHADSAACWIAADGQWGNGPRRGQWSKPHVEFVGHRAREAARQRRIAECEAALADLLRDAEALGVVLADIQSRREALAREVANAPKTGPLLQLAADLSAAQEHLRATQHRLDEAGVKETAASQVWQAAREQRDRDAADLDLAAVAEPEALAEFKDALSAFREQASAFWPLWKADGAAVRERVLSAERLASDAGELQVLRGREAETRGVATDTQRRATTLQETLGASIQDVLSRLNRAKANRVESQRLRDQLDRAVRDGEKEEATLQERRRATDEKRDTATEERLHAVRRMEAFAAHRLFEEVDPAFQPARETLSPSAAVDHARQMEKELAAHAIDDTRWNTLQSELIAQYQEFADQLGRQGHMPRLEKIDESGVSVIRCDHQGKPRTLYAFSQLLAAELDGRERLFEEREREVIENHLIGEAAHALQARIRDGDEWVRNVNQELEQAHTSSGIRLRFEWRVADGADPELPGMRNLFLRAVAAWTPEERQRIADFLQARIAAARESDEHPTWREVLHEALDYRTWHRFGIQRKKEGETGWRRLTKKTFGTGSGGEKAVTLTVPQFAAAAAHYQSADSYAPRLILLDEVFAGIDSPTRARLMGLLETFDLDYVMTSQLEWGVYPEVSSLAIYQLASRPTSSAVAVTRWLWNGRDKRAVREDAELNGGAEVEAR